mgnify:CR=1 FL=1
MGALSGLGAFGGVVGDSSERNGVAGLSGSANGVFGASAGRSSFNAVAGVLGDSSVRYGVAGFSTSNAGMRAASSSGSGIYASSTSGIGAVVSGGRAPLQLTPKSTPGRPTSGTHGKGELVVDSAGSLFICTATGTPGTWKKVTVTSA